MRGVLFSTLFIDIAMSVFSQCPKKLAYDDYHANITNTTMTSSEIGWDGDLNSCDAGNINDLAKENMIKRINYFRRQAGVDYPIVHKLVLDKYPQEAVLIQHANNSLTHIVDNSYSCYSSDGAHGSLYSNLGYGSNAGPGEVNGFIEDAGVYNADVGHRWWLLWPQMTEVGVGATNKYTAIYIKGDRQEYPADIEFHAYPGEGYNSSDLVYDRWSFAMPEADFSNSTVEILKPDGVTLVRLKDDPLIVDMGGDDMLVWEPSSREIYKNSPFDQSYKVTIKNIVVEGLTKDISYNVIIFDAQEDWENCPEPTVWSDSECGCVDKEITAIDGFSERNFKVTPNPFFDEVNLIAAGERKYKVYSVYGKLIEKGFFKNEMQIGQDWKSGLYIVNLYDGFGSVESHKVIKK